MNQTKKNRGISLKTSLVNSSDYKYIGLLTISLVLSILGVFYLKLLLGYLAIFAVTALIGKKLFNLNAEQVLPIALAIGVILFHQSAAEAVFLQSTETLVNTALASTGGAVDGGFITTAFAIIRTIVVVILAGIVIVGIVRGLRQDDYMFCVQAFLAILIGIIGIESIANLVVA